MKLRTLKKKKLGRSSRNVVEDAAAREEVRVTRGHRKRARKGRCITSGAM